MKRSKWGPEIRLQSLARCTLFRPQSLAFWRDTSGLWFTSRVQKNLPLCSHFSCCKLHVQSDKIPMAQDALESMVARESVQGYTIKTKQEVEMGLSKSDSKDPLLSLCCTCTSLFTRSLVGVRSLSKILNILWMWKLVKNCFFQELKIRMLNATDPTDYLQWSPVPAQCSGWS